ncbi:MAG: DUF695 domain-containing protein [Bacteroidales bacterium]
MKLTDEWFSAISEAENGQLVIITGRDNLHAFMRSGKFNDRVESRWKYVAVEVGLRVREDAKRMELMDEALRSAVEKNKLAIMTTVYTGGGEKSWVFYTRTSAVFFQTLNEALSSFELFPLELFAEKDPDWEEYQDMYEMKKQDEEEDND